MPDAQGNLTEQEAVAYYTSNTDLQQFKPSEYLIQLEDGTARPAANLTEALHRLEDKLDKVLERGK